MKSIIGYVLATLLATTSVLIPTSALAAPASATTPQERPAGAGAEQHVQSRCLVWRRTTVNYSGLTAGYSWAWNVEVVPGASGDRVREIQCLLDYWGHYDGPLDGYYSSDTAAAVSWAQFLCSVYQNGVVGAGTWRCLRAGGEV